MPRGSQLEGAPLKGCGLIRMPFLGVLVCSESPSPPKYAHELAKQLAGRKGQMSCPVKGESNFMGPPSIEPTANLQCIFSCNISA